MKLISNEQADMVADLYAASLRLIKLTHLSFNLSEKMPLLGGMVSGFSDESFEYPVYTANTQDLATDKDVKKQYDDFEDVLFKSFNDTDFVLGLFTTPDSDSDEGYRYILTLFLKNSAGQILNPWRLGWTKAGLEEASESFNRTLGWKGEWDDTIYLNYTDVRESWGFTTTEIESHGTGMGYEIIIYALERVTFSFKKTLNWRQFPKSLV